MTGEPLTKILLFRYGGADSGNRASQFDEFRAILDSKAKAIPGLFSDIQDAVYLAKLSVVDPKRPGPANLEESRNLLQTETALQLFEGLIDEDPDHNYWVTSNVFLGELGKKDSNLRSEAIKVRLRVSASEFRSLKDAHTLVILYTLFLDAQRIGRSKQLQAGLLEQSRRILSQLARRGDLEEDVKLLGVAVENTLRGWG